VVVVSVGGVMMIMLIEEWHVTWLELFFDLVVVVGIVMLVYFFEEDFSFGGIVVYVIVFIVIWMIWVCFMFYSNVIDQEVYLLLIFEVMFVFGVMIVVIFEI